MAVLKDLIVHGASRFLGDSYFNEIVTDEISLRKIKAKQDNTISIVAGLVDVDGELHTKSFTNSNIATIDGNFYITPTITIQGGETNNYWVSATTNSLSFSGTSYDLGSAYLDGSDSAIAWSIGSKVVVTGEVLLNNEWIPLGTLKGTLSTYSKDTSPNSIVIDGILDSINQSSKVLPLIAGMGNLQYRKVKVSLISINRSGLKPLGIYMTAAGPSGKTFLDIYGGNLAETSSYDGLSTPVLRIGNLKGLPAINNVGDQILPNGWGIYTSNGFFSGTIVAKQGQIGSYKINSEYLQSSDGTTGLSIKDDSNTLNWAFWAGGNSTSTASFRVTHDGTLYCKNIQATGGSISGNVSIGGNVTIASTVTIGGKNQSEYLNSNIEVGGRNLLLNTSNNEVSFTSTVKDYTVSSSISNIKSTDSLTISFWAKASVSLWTDFYFNDGTTSWANTSYFFPSFQLTTSWVYYTYTGPASEKAATSTILRFRQNSTEHAGASAVGTVYVKGLKLEKGNKATDWTPAPEDIDVNKYVTEINDNGIWVTPQNKKPSSSNGATGTKIDGEGVGIYKEGIKVAQYGENIIIGQEDSGQMKISSEELELKTNNGITMFDVDSSNKSVTIGASDLAQINFDGYHIEAQSNITNSTALELFTDSRQNGSQTFVEKVIDITTTNTSPLLTFYNNGVTLKVSNSISSVTSVRVIVHMEFGNGTTEDRDQNITQYSISGINTINISANVSVFGANLLALPECHVQIIVTYVSVKVEDTDFSALFSNRKLKIDWNGNLVSQGSLSITGTGYFDTISVTGSLSSATGNFSNTLSALGGLVATTGSFSGEVNFRGGCKINNYTPIVVETVTADNITINGNSLYTWDKTGLTKTGYTLAGVVGFGVSNATTSGTNSSLCTVYYCRKNSASSIQMLIRNTGSASSASANSYGAAKVKLTADLLWIANGII